MAAPWVLNLLDIQKIDQRIHELNVHLGMLPAERKRIAAAKAREDAKLAAVADDARKLQQANRQDESEIAALRDKIAKIKQQSALVRKNAEYQTMMAEAEMLTKQIGTLETRVLERLEELDRTRERYRKQQQQNAAAIRDLKAEWMEFDKVEKEIKKDIETGESERRVRAKRVEKDLWETYEELLRHNDGAPLVPVKDGDICGNCCLKLTPQTLMLARRGSVVVCDNCRHLVYTEEVP